MTRLNRQKVTGEDLFVGIDLHKYRWHIICACHFHSTALNFLTDSASDFRMVLDMTPLVVSPNLCAITTIFHRAPSPAPVSASIKEEPAALIVYTLSNSVSFFGGQKSRRIVHNRPEHPIYCIFFTGPVPGKLFSFHNNL